VRGPSSDASNRLLCKYIYKQEQVIVEKQSILICKEEDKKEKRDKGVHQAAEGDPGGVRRGEGQEAGVAGLSYTPRMPQRHVIPEPYQYIAGGFLLEKVSYYITA